MSASRLVRRTSLLVLIAILLLSASLHPAPARAAAPANDNAAGAIALALDTPVAGSTAQSTNDYQLSGGACFAGVGQTASVAAGADVVYSFTPIVAGAYLFRVTGYTTARNLVLYVAGALPSGAPPQTIADCLGAANRSSNSSAEEVAGLALAAGQPVFVVVDEHSATIGSPFTIEVNQAPLEAEPNDTPAQASALACGVAGAITPAGDADFFSLGAPAAGARVFALADGVGAGEGDLDLRVTTATDTLEYDDSDNTAPFGALAPNLAGTPLTGAETFIRVSYYTPAAQSDPYRLYAVVQPPISSSTSEIEPNDTVGQAGASVKNYISGALAGPAPSADTDLYAFDAAAGDLLFLGLDGDPLRDNTPVNAKLELLDAAGLALVSANDASNSSSAVSGAGSLAAMTPNSPAEGLIYRARATATYYARVSIGTSSTGASGAGDYLLSIARNCRAGAPPRITSTSPPAATTVGAPYSHTFTASGWPTPTFSLAAGSLPPGLALSGDGQLLGTPTAAGEYRGIAVQAGNGLAPDAIQAFDIVVAKGTPSLFWAVPATITYGTPLGAAQLDATADVTGTFTYTPSLGVVLDAGAGQTLTATFTPADGASYNSVSLSAPISVTKALLTVTADNQMRRVGAPNPPLMATYSGFMNGDTPADLDTPAGLTTTAGLDSPPGGYPIVVSGASGANYDIAFANGTLTVTDKLVPAIAWGTPSPLVYGTPLGTAQLNASADVSGTFSYDPPLGTLLNAGAAQTLSVTFTPADSANYAVVTRSVTIVVSRAVLTVTPESRTRAYGAANPPLTVQYSGFVNGDTLADAVAGSPACTTSATPSSPAGTYPIVCAAGTLSAANYTFRFVAGTLRVTSGPSYWLYMPLMRGARG